MASSIIPRLLATKVASSRAAFSTSAFRSVAKVQKPAPSFAAKAVVNGEFKDIKLEDYRGKYVVLFFYPLDFTFVCPTEVIAFSDQIQQFKDLDCEVILRQFARQHS